MWRFCVPRKHAAALRPRGHGNAGAVFRAEGGDATASSSGGTVVIFDWAETLRDLLSRTEYHAAADEADVLATASDPKQPQSPDKSASDAADGWSGDVDPVCGWREEGGASSGSGERGANTGARREKEEIDELAEELVEIVHGEAFTDRKSTFQAHLARVTSERQVGLSWPRCRTCFITVGRCADGLRVGPPFTRRSM